MESLFDSIPNNFVEKSYFTGIGSRITPFEILNLMKLIGKKCCDLGLRLRSGNAEGADTAFYEGVLLSQRFKEIGCSIYLPTGRFRGYTHSPENGFFDSTLFQDSYSKAFELARQARGGFNGLSEFAIALQVRSVFQVLGSSLRKPSLFLICWAPPSGGNKVVGGTNTAVQIAHSYKIPVYNLFEERTFLYFSKWVK